LLCPVIAVTSASTVGVVKTNDEYEVLFDVPYDDSFCAWAEFEDTLTEVGWGKVAVVGNDDDASIAHYCSGIAEAALTHTRISQYFSVYYNNYLEEYGGTFPKEIEKWLTKSMEWTRSMADRYQANDAFWNSIYNMLSRFDGLVEGYNRFRDEQDAEFTELQFVVLQSAGDMLDLSFVVSKHYPELRKKVMSDAWRDTHHHCTGLIFMEKDYENVYVAHDSWHLYNTMNRMLKDYTINSKNKYAATTRWTISSNAGLLLSMDDFWIMNSGLVVTETTVNTFNTTLYDMYCTPDSVLSWLRVSAVNLIAKDGASWAKYFNTANSFTYNNQYMVIDTNKFVRGKKPEQGFLVSTEQVPGYFHVLDRTEELCQKRWVPGINTPFDEEIFNASGYLAKVQETQCGYWSYYECCRYLIMDRDVIKKIHSYDDFKTFMRYNDWQTDPLSNNDAAQSISSRYDLRPDSCIHQGTMTMCPNALGGIDAKATNMDLAKKLVFDAISSPQYETQPAWEFGTGRFKNVRYDGLPKVWKFPWIRYGPTDH